MVLKLRAWRRRNELSQRAAAEVMNDRGFKLRLSTLQTWERGYRKPSELISWGLGKWLEENPRIENPPRYRSRPKFGK